MDDSGSLTAEINQIRSLLLTLDAPLWAVKSDEGVFLTQESGYKSTDVST